LASFFQKNIFGRSREPAFRIQNLTCGRSRHRGGPPDFQIPGLPGAALRFQIPEIGNGGIGGRSHPGRDSREAVAAGRIRAGGRDAGMRLLRRSHSPRSYQTGEGRKRDGPVFDDGVALLWSEKRCNKWRSFWIISRNFSWAPDRVWRCKNYGQPCAHLAMPPPICQTALASCFGFKITF